MLARSLREVRYVRPEDGGLKRKWWSGSWGTDVIIWEDDRGTLSGFQISCAGHFVAWRRKGRVETGEVVERPYGYAKSNLKMDMIPSQERVGAVLELLALSPLPQLERARLSGFLKGFANH
ncbi:MAG: hypothetical protein GMKNLPBB_01005 [Myxococcota bacterium]|nr:hypothetical protein [Myxococcota bacterium]